MSSLATDVYGGELAIQPNATGRVDNSFQPEPVARTSATAAHGGAIGVLHKPFFFYVAAIGLAVLLIHLSVHAEFGVSARKG